MSHINDLGSAVLIRIPDTKTNKERSFTITGTFYNIFKQYFSLRPKDTSDQRFFLNYQNKRCTRQPVGINKIASIPKQIAIYLGLKNPERYTGHCYRRSSATIYVDAGADVTSLKRHGGWKSTSVAEGYIEESLQNKLQVAHTITNAINRSSDAASIPQTSCSSSRLHIVPEDEAIFPSVSNQPLPTQLLISESNENKANSKLPIIFNNCYNNNITINYINEKQ